jgi:uracil-DNA glycosylase family 4
MENSQRVLSRGAGPLDAAVMFVGEAPGRLGADGSEIAFHGDKSGHNFEDLLDQVGLSRYSIFVTNAVLCNPRDEQGNNSTPNKVEVSNCSRFLKRQIDLIDPKIVVTLGSTALGAVSAVELHVLNLRDHVRTAHQWYGRTLIPAYHPGQRAMIHRSFANQLSDYEFISERLRRLGRGPRKVSGSSGRKTLAVVDLMTRIRPEMTYFALHKLFYLAEVESVKLRNVRMTDAFIVRQKDGPYCTELHPVKLKKALPDLRTVSRNDKLLIVRSAMTLFSDVDLIEPIDEVSRDLVKKTMDRYGGLDDSRLKTLAYLTPQMKRILRSEKSGRINTFNTPIDFGVVG